MSSWTNSHYQDYINNRPVRREVGAKAVNSIKSNKIVNPGRTGALPISIRNIVKKYHDESDMKKFGVIESPNSLLHCLCVAKDIEGYTKLTTDKAKEKFVVNMRLALIDQIYPSLLKQELYDCTEQEIINLLADTSRFFDPSLFYRALEEVYDLNIYSFSPFMTTDGVELGAIDVPRFKVFHSRPIRLDRNTMIVFKTSPNDFDALKYPNVSSVTL